MDIRILSSLLLSLLLISCLEPEKEEDKVLEGIKRDLKSWNLTANVSNYELEKEVFYKVHFIDSNNYYRDIESNLIIGNILLKKNLALIRSESEGEKVLYNATFVADSLLIETEMDLSQPNSKIQDSVNFNAIVYSLENFGYSENVWFRSGLNNLTRGIERFNDLHGIGYWECLNGFVQFTQNNNYAMHKHAKLFVLLPGYFNAVKEEGDFVNSEKIELLYDFIELNGIPKDSAQLEGKSFENYMNSLVAIP